MLVEFINIITKEKNKKIINKKSTIEAIKYNLAFDYGVIKMNLLIKKGDSYELLDDLKTLEHYPIKKGSEIIVSPIHDTSEENVLLNQLLSEICKMAKADIINKNIFDQVSLELILYEDLLIGSDITLYIHNMDKTDIEGLLFDKPNWEICIMCKESYDDISKMISNNIFELAKYRFSELTNIALDLLNRVPHPQKNLAIKIFQSFRHWVKLPFTLISDSEDGEHNKESINLYKFYSDLEKKYNK